MSNNPNSPGAEDMKLSERRISDLCRAAESVPVTTDFLTPAEQRYAAAAVRKCTGANDAYFYGGSAGCLRRCLILLPDWAADADIARLPTESDERCEYIAALVRTGTVDCGITTLSLRGSGWSTLTRRDWMGSLLALGVEREVIGDIAVTGDFSAAVFVRDKIAPFIIESLVKAGRDKVCAAKYDGEFILPLPKTEKISVTVASLRLDAVVAALCGVSRDSASRLCESGMTDLSYITQTAKEKQVAAGDILSVRGYGKFIIGEVGGSTRHGKLRLSAEKYI